LALIADGMGGHAAGEVASQLAAEAVLRTYYAQSARNPAAALRRAFMAANQEVHQAARRNAACAGMGTTCTALAIVGGKAYVAHVGDSRLYLLRDGALRQLTDDHSLVGELVRGGQLSPEQARRHGARNVILRALGRHAAVDVAVLRRPLTLAAGDRFLLCSDGLSDLVTDETMAGILGEAEPEEACRRLIACAMEAGGSDNVTAGVFTIGAARTQQPVRATRMLRLAEAEP
jgi:protein phosphatase